LSLRTDVNAEDLDARLLDLPIRVMRLVRELAGMSPQRAEGDALLAANRSQGAAGSMTSDKCPVSSDK
jgi:hypothetical protein